MTFIRTAHFLALAAFGALTACNERARSEVVAPQPIAPGAMAAVSPSFAAMKRGDSLRFVASFTPPSTATVQWLWTSSDSARVTVDSTGLARARETPTPGTLICATLKSDLGRKGCATLVIQAF